MSAATFLEPWQLRAAFARSLSDMYGREVPAYTTLLDVSHEVNADVVAKHAADAERLGTLARVTAERHGAIRVGTPTEMSQVARIFGAMGMHPVGFYDLRDASRARSRSSRRRSARSSARSWPATRSGSSRRCW